MDYQERTWDQLTLERGRQLFQEALSHLEVALEDSEHFKYRRDSDKNTGGGGCWSPECECGLECGDCGAWYDKPHYGDCRYAAAEAFLAKHKEK